MIDYTEEIISADILPRRWMSVNMAIATSSLTGVEAALGPGTKIWHIVLVLAIALLLVGAFIWFIV